jgi:hypothetical protein
MRKLILIGLLAGVFMVVQTAGAQDDAGSSEGVSVTIFNQGTALIQDRRVFDLLTGLNTLDFTDVAASIDATSVTFKSLTDPQGTYVLEQNYVYDLVGISALLARYVDQAIAVTLDDGTLFNGTLLSGSGSDIILQQADGQVVYLSGSKVRSIAFPSLPDGLITRPTLRWLLQSAAGGPQQVELTYLAGGINWTADYNVLLNSDNSALDLNGWVTLTNSSGAAYREALVKLVAGDVNRLPEPGMAADGMLMEERAYAAAPAPQVEQREFFEYKLYEIQRPVTIGNNETKQVEFVTAAGVPAATFYVYDGSPPFYGYYGPNTDQYYGQTGVTDVQNWLEFTTGEDAGVGAALPAGRIRVYQEDTDGAALLIGENTIDHTPKGEDLRIFLGNAFDLVGEHTQTNFQIIGRNVIEETYEIRLRNRKDDQAVEIRVPEHLFRWSNWDIVNASDSFEKLDASTIEFRVTVPPGGEKVITYTVRYTWS